LPGSDGLIDWVTYLHTDSLGTPHIGTDASQNLVWRWDGEGFGQTLPNQAVPNGAYPVYVNLRNPGQYFDQETGLFYNMARYYNPQTGRYISSDPIGLWGGLNSYAFAGDNPLSRIDPLGLCTDPYTCTKTTIDDEEWYECTAGSGYTFDKNIALTQFPIGNSPFAVVSLANQPTSNVIPDNRVPTLSFNNSQGYGQLGNAGDPLGLHVAPALPQTPLVSPGIQFNFPPE
jgi:RHS repeat-associated protein